MKIWIVLWIVPAWAFGTCAPPVETVLEDWDRRWEAHEAATPEGHLSDRQWVKRLLRHMVGSDQQVREFTATPAKKGWSDEDAQCFFREFAPRWETVDRTNTKRLKRLLRYHHWFFRTRWGAQADDDAWLLVQHADRDRPFQIRILKRLRMLYRSGETLPAHYAYLSDRVAAAWSFPHLRRPQRYGTQGRCVGPGKWEPLPMVDPSRVDAWRKEMGMGPLSDTLKHFESICT